MIRGVRKAAASLFFGMMLVMPGYALAAAVAALYDEQVRVLDQSAAERERVLPDALGRVVDRVSGSHDWREMLDPAALESAGPALLEEFRYEELPEALNPSDPADLADAAELADEAEGDLALEEQPPRFELFLRFSEGAMNKWLSDQGIAVWGRDRPEIIAWVGVEASGGRFLVGEGQGQIANELLDAAAYWGLPVKLPILDLEDRNSVSMPDLWGFFGRSFVAASERYGTDVILMVKQYRRAGRSVAQWQLRDAREVLDAGEVEARSGGEARGKLMEAIAGSLSGRFAVGAGEGGRASLQLEVSGLSSYRAYGACQALLEGLAPVEALRLRQFSGSTALWEVDLTGSLEQFEAFLALGNRLKRTSLGSELNTEMAPLSYRWTGSD